MTDYYSQEEVARRLGKSEDQVQEMVSNGELRAFRDAGSFKFRKADIDGLAAGAPSEPEPEGVPVAAEAEAEEERDELLFLIDEEGTSADPDDLTLIGDSDEVAILAADEPEGMFAEEVGLAEGQDVDDEALTAVMETAEAPTAEAEPAVDIFAEAQEEMAVEEPPEAGVVSPAPFSHAERMRRLHEAAEQRSPVMSVLLVVSFLALLWAGVVVYSSFMGGGKPIMEWLGRGG